MRRESLRSCFTGLEITALVCCVFLILSGNPGWATVYVVSNTLDNGGGSLRDQITAANTNPGADEIIFAIPGSGPHTIQPLSALPTITDSLVIDGYTQPGASSATPAAPAVMMIELDGQLVSPGTDGLAITGNGCVVRGLVINRFSSWGIILPYLAEGATIEGNYIGTDVSGTLALGNGSDGIHICDAVNCMIGGTTSASRNIVSGNDYYGISVCPGMSSGNLVQGNYIGTDATGTVPLGNLQGGIVIYNSDNTYGGIGEGTGNVIAYNGGAGVVVTDGITGSTILGNAIFSNEGLGIDLGADGVTLNDPGDPDTGANNLQNHPLLSLVDPGPPLTLVDVSLNSTPNTMFRFEFFENSFQDTSGFGEGEIFAGWADWATDAGGNAFFTVFFDPPLPPEHCISATATDPSGNTSEFSPVLYVGGGIMLTGQAVGDVLQLDWTALPGAVAYQLYGAENHAYFEIGPANFLIELPSSVTTYSGLPAVGDPNLNWAYVVVAVGDYYQEMARSNRFGEWDFGLGGP